MAEVTIVITLHDYQDGATKIITVTLPQAAIDALIAVINPPG